MSAWIGMPRPDRDSDDGQLRGPTGGLVRCCCCLGILREGFLPTPFGYRDDREPEEPRKRQLEMTRNIQGKQRGWTGQDMEGKGCKQPDEAEDSRWISAEHSDKEAERQRTFTTARQNQRHKNSQQHIHYTSYTWGKLQYAELLSNPPPAHSPICPI